MKSSAFNRYIQTHEGKTIAFNAMSCALAEIDDGFQAMMERIKTGELTDLNTQEKELLEQMRYGGYVVDKDMDELKVIQYRQLNGKYAQDSFGLTIAPTLACNFACPYCYEEPQDGLMKQKVQDDIVQAVEKMAKKGRDITITWYGGEPLVGKSVVFSMSERMIAIAEKYDVSYNAYIVTNGYLLTDEIIDRLKDYKVYGAQITIDGPPEIHNTRRILKNSSEPTFDVIIANAKKMLAKDFDVTIRINIDKTNLEYIQPLLEILDAKDMKDANISLGQVTAYTDACNSVTESCLNTEEYAQVLLEYQKRLHDAGYNVVGYPYYPGVKANYCCADSTGSYVVDQKGDLYKCWNDIGNSERTVGNISQLDGTVDEKAYRRNLDYILWSPFNFEKCKNCDILPVCMGGCPYYGELQGNEPECEKWRYNIDEILLLTYEQRKEGIAVR